MGHAGPFFVGCRTGIAHSGLSRLFIGFLGSNRLDKASEIRELLEPVVRGLGFCLWGVEVHAGSTPVLLRVYIDHAEGISVDDCGAVSGQVSAILDIEEPIRGDYILEVSSPGIERPLFVPEQYRQYLNAPIKVRLHWPEHGRRNYRGILRAVSETFIVVEVEGSHYTIPLNSIARARLVEPEPEKPGRAPRSPIRAGTTADGLEKNT
jgi:ribosome maturation factor RimP